MKLDIKVASTSQTVNVFIQDSSSTTGAGLTGLAFNTASLVAYYALPRAAAVAITLATQTVTGAYSSGGFVEISSANMPGWYRLDIPDAALASGRFVDIHMKGATNMAPLPLEIELTGWDNQDAVHGGMSALPNTAVTTNGSLITSGSGTAQLTVTGGLASANSTQIGGSTTAVTNLSNGLLGTAGSAPSFGIADQGTAQAATGTTLTIRAAASFGDNECAGMFATITSSTTGAQQTQKVLSNVGSTDVLTLAAPWPTTPTGTITYVLWYGAPGATIPDSVTIAAGGITNASYAADTTQKSARSSTAQAGGATSITLDASASAVTDFYKNALVIITGGTGAIQGRFITAYNGTTKVATVTSWATNPDNTSTFTIMPFDAIVGATAPTAAQNATAVWQDLLSGSDFSTVGSVGKLLKDDVDAAISTRASPTNITAGTITTVTNLTNAPTVGDFTATMKASITTAVPTATQNADALLGRNVGGGSSAGRTVSEALYALRNRWTSVAGVYSVYATDDTTVVWTSALGSDAAALPLVSSDPT